MRYPDEADVVETANRLGLSLTSAELHAVHGRILDELEARGRFMDQRYPTLSPPISFPTRSPGGPASDEDDPLNAWLWRCNVGGDHSAPGAGAADVTPEPAMGKVGVLQGRTVGLKDHISLAGIPLSLGSHLLQGLVPDIDASVVTRVLDAGATVVGKLNMDNFSSAASGLGGTGDMGRVRNPWASDHLAGGSSSGAAAAVSAGDCDIALAGDQAGSVRVPAAWCGVLGLKPTFGLVPHTGVVSASEPSIDHIGPLTRTTADLAAAMSVLSGPDGIDPRQFALVGRELPDFAGVLDRGVEGVRIGVLAEGFASPIEADVDAAVRQALRTLEGLGATVDDVSVPAHDEVPAAYAALSIEGASMLLETYFVGAFSATFLPERILGALGAVLDAEKTNLPANMKLNYLIADYTRREYHGRVYARGVNVRPHFVAAYDKALQDFDVLVMPTAPMKAPAYTYPRGPVASLEATLFGGKSGAQLVGIGRNTLPFDYTGHPALSVPCGVSAGLPIGMQFVARHFADDLLVQVAAAYEKVAPWPSPDPSHPTPLGPQR